LERCKGFLDSELYLTLEEARAVVYEVYSDYHSDESSVSKPIPLQWL
jgi:hypothetical protein